MKTIEINNKHYIDAKIIMLVTENYKTDYKLLSGEIIPVVKLGQLILNKDNNQLSINKNSSWSATCDTDILIPQHLYITSNEEIKEGDFIINAVNNVQLIRYTKDANESKFCHKIIASTDKLIPENTFGQLLPQPSKEFIQSYIESYNKGEVIEDVLVEVEEYYLPLSQSKLVDKETKVYLFPNGVCSEYIYHKDGEVSYEINKGRGDNYSTKHFKLKLQDNTIIIKEKEDS